MTTNNTFSCAPQLEHTSSKADKVAIQYEATEVELQREVIAKATVESAFAALEAEKHVLLEGCHQVPFLVSRDLYKC